MSMRFPCALACALLFGSTPAYGQTAGPPVASVGARTHFNEGLARVTRGEFDVALQEFEAAYALKPHYSVLYNIGQAHAALGHPTEAVQAFQRYLIEGGKRLSQTRRDQVRALIAVSRAKLGELRLLGVADSTRVWVDGVEVEKRALDAPLLLTAGKHSVLSSNGGGFPKTQEAVVPAGGKAEVALPTAPASVSRREPRPEIAQLRVVCDLPGVTVDVGEATHATTPVPAPLTVMAGPLNVKFSRPGYVPVTHRVVATAVEAAVTNCDQVPESVLQPAVQAKLVVRTQPFDAELFVDGVRFLGAPLPYGPHELRVARDGFLTQTRPILLRPRDVTTYQVTLVATPARQAERVEAESRRKVIGYATGGGGLLLAITGAALYGWNGGRYATWRREHTSASVDSQLNTVTSIQRVDDLSVGFAALGAGLIATGAWLLLTGPAEAASY